MSRPDRPQLGWKRPPEWDRFEAAVEEKHGATTPYCGFALEQAWYEYRDDHPAEEYVERLLEAVGNRGRPTREKNLSRTASVEDDRQVWVSVREEIKREMAQFATEAGVPNYKVLRAVVCWYIDGGLLGCLTKKLEKAVPEAEAQLADLDRSAEASLGTKERRTVELVRGLGDGAFTRNDFREKLREVRGISDSDYCRDEYLPRVLDRLDYTTHPNNSDLFVPKEQAREYANDEDDLDGPAIDRLPYADLTDEKRVRGLRVEAVRKAEGQSNKLYALGVQEVRGGVFDGIPSKRKAKALMNRAAQASGFSTDAKGGRKRLTVDLSEVNYGLLSDAGLEVDDKADSGGPDDGVEEQMDTLTNAIPVTSGGREDS